MAGTVVFVGSLAASESITVIDAAARVRNGKRRRSRLAAAGTCSVFVVAAMFLSAGCGPAAAPERDAQGGRLPVFAGIPPVAYLVEQIGGNRVAVGVLVQPGQNPHTFEPSPRQVASLSRAVLFFRIGMPFEDEIVRKTRTGAARSTVVDVDRGLTKRKVESPCCASSSEHDHAADADHRCAESDPHVWLSPRLLKVQAANIAESLCRVDPAHRADYEKNLALFQAKLDALDRRVRERLAPYRGRTFYVFHPGFGYFADAYGLHEKAVEAAGRMPSPRQLRELIEQAKSDGATTIFLQPQYAPQGAQLVALQIGGDVVAIDGLGKDVLADIEDIAQKIEGAMQKKPRSATGAERSGVGRRNNP